MAGRAAPQLSVQRGPRLDGVTDPLPQALRPATETVPGAPGQVAGQQTVQLPVLRYRDGHVQAADDDLAAEEPLELRLSGRWGEELLTLTMRTPGHDRLWALGWLHAEGLLDGELPQLSPDPEVPNVLRLHTEQPERYLGAVRRTLTTSACGVCGSGSVERLAVRAAAPVWSGPPLAPSLITALPERLRAAQPAFAATGGLHAAGLFDPQGQLLAAYEDVGRHNATDKLVGWAVTRGALPLSDRVVVTTSRAGFEIAQKALLAGAPVLVTVGAPSSLAVDTAAALGLTLVGFVRGERFNVYCGAERVGG